MGDIQRGAVTLIIRSLKNSSARSLLVGADLQNHSKVFAWLRKQEAAVFYFIHRIKPTKCVSCHCRMQTSTQAELALEDIWLYNKVSYKKVMRSVHFLSISMLTLPFCSVGPWWPMVDRALFVSSTTANKMAVAGLPKGSGSVDTPVYRLSCDSSVLK